jgi:hypothetical protein
MVVSSDKREPNPPAKTTAFMLLPPSGKTPEHGNQTNYRNKLGDLRNTKPQVSEQSQAMRAWETSLQGRSNLNSAGPVKM